MRGGGRDLAAGRRAGPGRGGDASVWRRQPDAEATEGRGAGSAVSFWCADVGPGAAEMGVERAALPCRDSSNVAPGAHDGERGGWRASMVWARGAGAGGAPGYALTRAWMAGGFA